MSRHPQDATAAPAALSAFLRGIERHGALFAELQCGDPDAGDAALAVAMRAFRNHAGDLPMAAWPRRFWALLLAAPQMRGAASAAHWPADVSALALLEPTHRQALLLRLAASLPEEAAAEMLGVDMAAYEQALAVACPRDAEGQPDALAWRTLAEAIQLRLRDLPSERLARLREAALLGRPETPSTLPRPATRPAGLRPSRRRWAWVVLVLVLCGAALAATWWWPHWRESLPLPGVVDPGVQRLQAEVPIESEAIPEQAPASRFNAADGLLMHPDFGLVLEAREEAIARQADFLAWYASGASELPEAAAGGAPHETPAIAEGTETNDAQF
ncbi:MAG: hypothetical protein ABI858_02755 [Pseudoxanthomonas sp.]